MKEKSRGKSAMARKLSSSPKGEKGGETMTPEEMKAKATRFVEEVINQGNLDRFSDYFVADYVDHVPLPPGFPSGAEGFKLFFGGLRAAFPDFHYTMDDTIVEGDKVVQRLTGQGTMQGAFQGMPPTGKHAAWSEIHISRIKGDKFVEHWATVDQLGMLQQLGVIAAPGQPAS
jgi:predicted ester cyclase